MKAWIGGLILSGIGFGVGFFAGERYGRKKANEAKQEPKLVEEKPILEQTKENAEEIIQQTGYVAEDGTDDVDSQVEEVNAYLAQFEHPDENDDPVEDDILEEPESKEDPSYIELVTADDWDAEEELNRVELTYYEDDEVVCDEDEQRVDDAEDLLGHEALHSFGTNLLNPDDVIYVKNHWMETIYQVTRIHNSYGRVVLGIDTDMEFYQP